MESCVKEILFSYKKGERGGLIPILQRIQEEFGYLPKEALTKVAQYLRIPESKVFGVASFYAQFRFKPIGKNRILVCRGTACHVKGAPQILEEIKRQLKIEEGETTSDLEYSLETVACIGCCALAPCIMINNNVQAKMTPKKVKELFAKRWKTLEEIKTILASHKEEIREKYGVVILAIFGSYTKEKQKMVSDVDILVEVERPIGLKFFELWDGLEKLLGCKVDLVRAKLLREEIKKNVMKEAIEIWRQRAQLPPLKPMLVRIYEVLFEEEKGDDSKWTLKFLQKYAKAGWNVLHHSKKYL